MIRECDELKRTVTRLTEAVTTAKERIAILMKERDSAMQRAVAAEKREHQLVKKNAHLTNMLEKTKGVLQDPRGSCSQKRKILRLSPKSKKGRPDYDTVH